MFDDPAKHLAYIIREVRSRGATVLEPPNEAEQAWGDTIRGRASTNNDFLKSCTPGYYNNEVAELGFGCSARFYTPGVNNSTAYWPNGVRRKISKA
jgi:cyclohexanone monooxygenase